MSQNECLAWQVGGVYLAIEHKKRSTAVLQPLLTLNLIL